MATIRGRITNTLKNLTAPTDALDKQLTSLLERATSEMWISPDWGLNMELVDLVNRRQNSATYEKLFKAMRRRLGKGKPKVQLLLLTVLETCVKNCGASFHVALGNSDLWSDIGRMVDNKKRTDLQVRDRMLVMVEDFSRSLRPAIFQKTYRKLKNQGVRFPSRPEEEVGFGVDTSPPTSPPTVPPQHAGGVSSEDLAAIQSALRELDEADSQRQREQRQGVERTRSLPTEYNPNLSALASSGEKLRADLKFARNSVDLFVDALGSIPADEPGAVWQDFIKELAVQCQEIKPRLVTVIESVGEEGTLGEALALFDDLSKAQTRHEELLAAALRHAQSDRATPQSISQPQLVSTDQLVSEDGGPTLVTNRRFPPPASQPPVIPTDPLDLLSAPADVPYPVTASRRGTSLTNPAPQDASVDDEFTRLAAGQPTGATSAPAENVDAGFDQLAALRMGSSEAGAGSTSPPGDGFDALVMDRSSLGQASAPSPQVLPPPGPSGGVVTAQKPDQTRDLITF